MRNPQPTKHSPIKWAGGKQRLIPKLLPHFPAGLRLIEPFLGAGSIFLNTDYPTALLGDANSDLIAVWVALEERPREFVARASAYFDSRYHSREAYEAVRAEFNESVDRFERAVRFMYLNKFGYNGMFRVNRKGAFNVPYGRPSSLPNFPSEAVEHAAHKLASASVLSGGFIGTMAQAGPGDVVYADPPYVDRDKSPSFVDYTEHGFGQKEQQALVQAAWRAASRGAHVLISNHDTAYARELYDGFELVELTTRRSVAAKAASRGVVNELLAILRPGQ